MRPKVQPHLMPWEIGDEAVLTGFADQGLNGARVRVKNRIQRSGRFQVVMIEDAGGLCVNSILEVSEERLDDPTLHDNLTQEERNRARMRKQESWDALEAVWHRWVADGEKERGLEFWFGFQSEELVLKKFCSHVHEYFDKK